MENEEITEVIDDDEVYEPEPLEDNGFDLDFDIGVGDWFTDLQDSLDF